MKHFAFQERRWWKMMVIWFYAIVMIGMCVFIISDYDFFNGRPQHTPKYIIAVAWIGLLFFGCGMIYAVIRDVLCYIRGRKPILVLEEGLYVFNDFVPWERITFIREWGKDMLMVGTNDCKERMARANFIKRMSMKANYKFSGAVIHIPVMEMDGSADDFVELCKPYLKKAESKRKNK